MKSKTALIVVLAVCLSSSLAAAGMIQGVTTFSDDFTINENGTPYWDNVSIDNSRMNIGYYVTNSGGFTGWGLKPPLTGPQYLTLTKGNADFYFNATYGCEITLKMERAGYANENTFGWYDRSKPTDLHELFNGPASYGASVSFVAPVGVESYGFYFKSRDGTYFTEASRDASSVTTLSHFAVFKGSNYPDTFIIGMEDLKQTKTSIREGCYGDFNDMVICVKAVPAPPVPLPGALLLLGAGLTRLVAYARRRQAN